MRTEDVRNFVAVANAQSLMAASLQLGISQPTLSKSMARLERAVGSLLIERLARGIRLTEAGRAFYAYARGADQHIMDAVSAVRDLRQGKAGSIRLAVGISVSKELIAAACQPLFSMKTLDIQISTGMSNTLPKEVLLGTTDFAITNRLSSLSPALKFIPLFRDPMIPVVTRDHPLANASSIEWTQLAHQNWLVPCVGTETRIWFDKQFLSRRLAPPSCIVSLSGYYPALEFASKIDGISLLPSSLLRDLDHKRYVEMAKPKDWMSRRIVGIVHRHPGYLSRVAESLIDNLIRTSQSFFPEMSC
ncbi:LysR family transcriptional regulator [Allopusillimonas ginsengisoli]|uniref:LysR family transcriptional regulator n=1 Tax=Allopusillimonas ginsengisoli TaxID=453575 RepID=UPI0010201E57|nr:LysR family transcriptional regulator [Allopusillimonas ginsengisoli]TEA77079.1 LysR family transcriptional regulator [Allopusillimonas ginsengisoli]